MVIIQEKIGHPYSNNNSGVKKFIRILRSRRLVGKMLQQSRKHLKANTDTVGGLQLITQFGGFLLFNTAAQSLVMGRELVSIFSVMWLLAKAVDIFWLVDQRHKSDKWS